MTTTRCRGAQQSNNSPSAPIAIDLFAGAGGLGEGLESAGIRVAAAVELHPQAALTYAFNQPDTAVIFGDMRSLSMDLLADKVASRSHNAAVDLVVGGPPCQGFSTAGKKVANDPRNSLFHQFVRVVEHFRPKMLLLENVPGFKKMHNGAAFSAASELFGELGYQLKDTLIEAAEHGVPQRRFRFVMVGWRRGSVAPFSWPEPSFTDSDETQGLLFRDSRLPYVTVEEALEDIAFLEPGWESHRHRTEPNSEYQQARRNGFDGLFNHLATRHREKAQRMFSFIAEGETISSVPAEIRSAKRTMARLDRSSISNAVLAVPDDLIHYRHDRIPTVREMARLQGFDDDYVFIGKRTSGFVERRVDVPQYTQVGNAVPPLLGRALGKALLASLGGSPRDLRSLDERRRRHRWVCGSSGFAGYSLAPEAQGKIDITDTRGEPCSLPCSPEDSPVCDAPPLVEWKVVSQPPRRGQWAPGVVAKTRPAHAQE